jgi:predicted NBD/HSP70 family sugar kinase
MSGGLADIDRMDRREDAPALARLGGGAVQAGGRAYNERLTLSLIRLNGPLPKAELARLTGLTAQTIAQIVRRLEADGLLVALPPLRGRIGQPSVPFAINPMGALSFGVKIGRRSAEVVLCDFAGEVLERDRLAYRYPAPNEVLAFVTACVRTMRGKLSAAQRYAGLGVALPFELWKWAEEAGAPPGALDGWRDIDLAGHLTAETGLAVSVANDATAACGAELAYGHRGSSIDLLYIFVGSFAGGGVALSGALQQGRSGNAGALGSMPVSVDGRSGQLIHFASLVALERALAAAGLDGALVQRPDADWSGLEPVLGRWISDAARALAQAVVAGASVFDFGHVTIDGAMPRSVLARLVDETHRAIDRHDLQGLSPFEVAAGQLGSSARALGGAMLPIAESYAIGQDVLLKSLVQPA